MGVKNDIKNTLATAKRWPRPLNRGGRWVEVSNTTVYWQINRDFGKWPLNEGWPLNRWPLNRGRTAYLLLAGWSVRLGKHCDRGLKNAALALLPGAAFSSLRSQFFTIWTDPEPFLPVVNSLTGRFVYTTLSIHRLTDGRLQNRLIC